MATDTEYYRELWGRGQAIENPQSAQTFFAVLDDSVVSGRLTEDDAYTLRQAGLSTLSEATTNDPKATEEIIFKHLLPFCLGEDEKAPLRISTVTSAMRELLRNWIDRFPDDQRLILLNKVIAEICKAVAGKRPRPAVWTLSTIGFRSPDVMRALRELAKRDDENGDAAISAIAGMGLPDEERGPLLTEIQERLARHSNTSLDFAIQEMPDPRFIDLIAPRVEKDENSFFAAHLLARIADVNPSDEKLQTKVWSIIKQAITIKSERRRDLIYAGDVGPRCNTKDVVATLGQWVPQYTDATARYVIYLRLEECLRPLQLLGWPALASDEIIATLRNDATSDTGATGQWMTTGHRIKESAWHIAIAAGVRNVSDWLSNAVQNETNPYSQHSVMETAANLALAEIPDAISEILRREVAINDQTDRSSLFPFIGAAEVAQSSATLQSLAVLTDSGMTYDGYVLRSTVEAVGEVAAWLTRLGNQDAIAKLIEKSRPPHSERIRSLAIGGLRQVAVRGMLSPSWISVLIENAEDKALSNHLRARSIEAVGLMPRGSVDKTVPVRLLAMISREENEDLSQAIFTAIANLGFGREFLNTLLPRLQIRRDQERCVLDRANTATEWQASVLSRLFLDDPTQLAEAAATLVREGSAGAVYHLLSPLTTRHDAAANSILVTAIVERINRIQTLRTSELFIFDVLCQIEPNVASVTDWEARWNGWMPDARAAMADGIGRTQARSASATRLLQILLSDATYAVRRAAARALATIDRTAIAETCTLWARSGRTDLRQRAAEASGWLSTDNSDPGEIPVLHQLMVDPEQKVRVAAKQALKDARQRQWATHCLHQLQRPVELPNEFVFAAYAYGRALMHLADDSATRSLQRMIQQYDLAPNIRHWFKQILKEAEQQWTKTTREWPQPWLPWSGDVEEVDGEVIINESAHPVHFSFWYRHRVTPTDPADWGGAFWPIKKEGIGFGAALASKVSIHVPGCPEARIVIASSSSNGSTIFSGTGAYPREART